MKKKTNKQLYLLCFYFAHEIFLVRYCSERARALNSSLKKLSIDGDDDDDDDDNDDND
jgi:hypothetical protein